MTPSSLLYIGNVLHHRLRPRAHRLRYRVFWMLLDIDRIDELSSGLRFFSRNKFNLVSFYNSDHGGTSQGSLRRQIECLLEQCGVKADGGRIALLCMPRILGYGFNPLSVFFCYCSNGVLSAIVYEVHNTFGERHSYVIRCDTKNQDAVAHQCNKDFYVSPFLGMDMSYKFRVTPPEEIIRIVISGEDADGPLIKALLSGKRKELSDSTLVKAVLTHPLLTLKVVAAIHLHAARMILKGFRIHPRSAGKPHSVTIVLNSGLQR